MNTPTYDKGITALLVVDPYNDFISEGGKIWPRIKAVAEANNCIPHMLEVLNAARRAKLRVFYAMHHRYRPGDYETWKYVAPIQRGAWQRKAFEYGAWGGEFRAEFVPTPGEIVAQEHWCSSGFANTDLDLQLKKHGIHQLIVVGVIGDAQLIGETPRRREQDTVALSLQESIGRHCRAHLDRFDLRGNRRAWRKSEQITNTLNGRG